MKLAAIARRGIRRDFWDLYAILENGSSLQEAARNYIAKFGVAQSDLYHVLRALTYFDDAEKDGELPSGLSERRWRHIKTFFESEAPKLIRPV